MDLRKLPDLDPTNAPLIVSSQPPVLAARGKTAAPDFQSQLKTQFKPPLPPPVSASAQVISESTTDMARRPDVEAMLQMLAWRKVTLNAHSKMGRSVPGVLASGLDIPDYSFADHGFLDSAEMINLVSADEHGIVLRPETIQDPDAESADSCGSDFIAGVAGERFEGGLNASAIAVALSGTILIWIPSEIVRAPLLSPRRRRKPSSVDDHQNDQADADVDNING